MTRSRADRGFLDANVLFSAAYREDSGLLRLWELERCRLLTSGLALEEARRNLDTEERRSRLAELQRKLTVVPEAVAAVGEVDWGLPPKDVPILAAAVAAGATHLLTGDLRDFGPLMGTRIEGVEVLRPAAYLRAR